MTACVRLGRTHWAGVVLVLGAIVALLVLFGGSGDTNIVGSRGEMVLKDDSSLETKTVQKETRWDGPHGRRPFVADHVDIKCSPALSRVKYFSQSQEDHALFKRYFSDPVICKGVYLEIGALDGVKYSNTKFFEDRLGWTGILIEAEPKNVKKLKANRPKSIVIPEAVCPEGQVVVDFVGGNAIGGVPGQMTDDHKKRWIKDAKVISVPCRPIGRMIRESNISAIDFFILDVEGAELMVLETMDWSIPVKVFVVEMGRGDRDKVLIDLLASKGYVETTWHITDFCLTGADCASNKVFENKNYKYPSKR